MGKTVKKDGRALARVHRSSVDEFINRWGEQRMFIGDLVKSGFLPQAIKTPEQGMAVILAGKELGIPPMLAMRKINIIKGSPTISPELMLALVRKSGQLKKMKILQNDETVCR